MCSAEMQSHSNQPRPAPVRGPCRVDLVFVRIEDAIGNCGAIASFVRNNGGDASHL